MSSDADKCLVVEGERQKTSGVWNRVDFHFWAIWSDGWSKCFLNCNEIKPFTRNDTGIEIGRFVQELNRIMDWGAFLYIDTVTSRIRTNSWGETSFRVMKKRSEWITESIGTDFMSSTKKYAAFFH